MALRPKQPLPQVRGTPTNPAALTTQLSSLGTDSGAPTETYKISKPDVALAHANTSPVLDFATQHAQIQRDLPKHSSTSTPPSIAQQYQHLNEILADSEMADPAALEAQMRFIIENLERLPQTEENRAQAAAMAKNLAVLGEKMDADVSAQPRFNVDAPEFTPSPVSVSKAANLSKSGNHRGSESKVKRQEHAAQERGRSRGSFSRNGRAAGENEKGVNPLNQNQGPGFSIPTFTFSTESPSGEQEQYTEEEAQGQLAAILGSSGQNNRPDVSAMGVSSIGMFNGQIGQMTRNPVTGRPRTPLAHLRAISDSAAQRRRSVERHAALQAQGQQQVQQNTQQLLQAQQDQRTLQSQQEQIIQQTQNQALQQQHAQQVQLQLLQQVNQVQRRYIPHQPYHTQQDYQNQQFHQPPQYQNQQPSHGQILNQIQQSMLFAPQQGQQQFPYGVNDMSHPPPNHSHAHPQQMGPQMGPQQMGHDFTYNNMHDFSQNAPMQPFLPQNFDNNPGMGPYATQYTNQVQQQHSMVFHNNNIAVNPPPEQTEISKCDSVELAPDIIIPAGPKVNGVDSLDSSKPHGVMDVTPQTQLNSVMNESCEDVAGYFPSAYELTGKWSTLPEHMRTPPEILRHRKGWGNHSQDHDNSDNPDGQGPSNGIDAEKTNVNGNADGNTNGSGSARPNGSAPQPPPDKNNSDQQNNTHNRDLSRHSTQSHHTGNVRSGTTHTWRSPRHTISGDYAALTRNAGHLDLLSSPAFPQSASEYAGLRADALAEKQARLTAQLKEMTRSKGKDERVREAMGGRVFDGYSAVLAERTKTWVPERWGQARSESGFPSVAEMKRELLLQATGSGSKLRSVSGSPGRLFPRPKTRGQENVTCIPQEYTGPGERSGVESAELGEWDNKRLWEEIVALKAGQISTKISEQLVGRGLLEQLT